jgi:hypothetical protein
LFWRADKYGRKTWLRIETDVVIEHAKIALKFMREKQVTASERHHWRGYYTAMSYMYSMADNTGNVLAALKRFDDLCGRSAEIDEITKLQEDNI